VGSHLTEKRLTSHAADPLATLRATR